MNTAQAVKKALAKHASQKDAQYAQTFFKHGDPDTFMVSDACNSSYF